MDKYTTITIIERTVRQFLVDASKEDDFDPFDDDTFIEELEVSDAIQESITDGWEFA